MATQIIGPRLKALRDERGLTQDEVVAILGVGSRQIVSQIETGDRRVSGAELLKLAEGLDVDLDYFTDPYRLEGEVEFSWRQHGLNKRDLKKYERVAGSWIAMYRFDAPRVGKPAPLMRAKLPLTKASSFEEASLEGERVARELGLGEVPAARLPDAMEKEFGILVLMVDAIPGISGAACRLPDLEAVLVNRAEVAGRRNFDLAHELFHIMTWEQMPPEYIEDACGEVKRGRIEQLADKFASALLMPEWVISRFGDWKKIGHSEIVSRLNKVADHLQVTAQALKWRLVDLGRLTRTFAQNIADVLLRFNGNESKGGKAPPPFSHRFMEVLGLSLGMGLVSRRKAAKLLRVETDQLASLFRQHRVAVPEGL